MQGELFVFLILLVFSAFALDSCGPNTIRTPCRYPCQPTCGQLTPKDCPAICDVNGCVCKPGYIRRDENGACILKVWCRMVAEEWDWDGIHD